jgi:hypothetical protein
MVLPFTEIERRTFLRYNPRFVKLLHTARKQMFNITEYDDFIRLQDIHTRDVANYYSIDL